MKKKFPPKDEWDKIPIEDLVSILEHRTLNKMLWKK